MPRPAPESDVRTHRMMFPNRRPLLISAVLVALTSIPTMIVVLAGSASLEDAYRGRAPAVVAPANGPLIVQPDASSAINESPGVARQSILALPTAEQPARVRGGPSRGSIGGAGGGSSFGAGRGPAPGPAAPAERECPTPPWMAPAPTKPALAPSHDAAPTGDGPPVGGDPSGATGSPGHGGSTRRRIDDNAWPGWDNRLKGRTESAPVVTPT